jgi:hypothetical protein
VVLKMVAPDVVAPVSMKFEIETRDVPMPAPMNGVMHHQVPRST